MSDGWTREYVVEVKHAELIAGSPFSHPFREEIMRCRDCKHYRDHEFIVATDVEHVCLFFADGVKVEPDGFCAWGEKRKILR